MEWLASIVGVIGIGGLIACIGFILLVLGIAGTGVEPLTGGIVLAIGAVAAIGGLLYAIPAFLNGDQVDLYEQAYADYSQRRIELTNEITAVNEVAVNLGVERLYTTCLVAGSDSAHRSIPREHIPNVHDMELLGVTCDSVSDLHDSTVTENADQPVLELAGGQELKASLPR